MSTINKDQEMLDKIASLYYKTSGDMRKMWEKKWYEGVKNVARKHSEMNPEKRKEDRLNK